MKYIAIYLSIFMSFEIHANQSDSEFQIKSFIEALIVYEETLINVEAHQKKLNKEIDQHVNDYKRRWKIDGDLEFKCKNGLKQFPNFSSYIPLTHLGFTIEQKCFKYTKIEESLQKLIASTKAIRSVLSRLRVEVIKETDEHGNIVIFLKRSKDDEKDQKRCGYEEDLCKDPPPWPKRDTPLGEISCEELRKPKASEWNFHYDFFCQADRVFLKSKKYKFVKNDPCERKNKIIQHGKVTFFQEKIGTYTAYTCVENKLVAIAELSFMPKRCTEYKREKGETWFTTLEITKHKCDGVCYPNEEVYKDRAAKYLWKCDDYGHIIPHHDTKSYPVGDDTSLRSVKIDAQVFKQTMYKDKYVTSSCKKANRQILRQTRCSKNMKYLQCPKEYPLELTMEERDILDYEYEGWPTRHCQVVSNPKGEHICGLTMPTFPQCYLNCRTQCLEDPESIVNPADIEIINYYPDAERTGASKK